MVRDDLFCDHSSIPAVPLLRKFNSFLIDFYKMDAPNTNHIAFDNQVQDAWQRIDDFSLNLRLVSVALRKLQGDGLMDWNVFRLVKDLVSESACVVCCVTWHALNIASRTNATRKPMDTTTLTTMWSPPRCRMAFVQPSTASPAICASDLMPPSIEQKKSRSPESDDPRLSIRQRSKPVVKSASSAHEHQCCVEARSLLLGDVLGN
jgi:hypothetical protein